MRILKVSYSQSAIDLFLIKSIHSLFLEREPYRYPNQKTVLCYPAYLLNPCPKLPQVQMHPERDGFIFRYKNTEYLKINAVHHQKLELLYYYNCRDDRRYNLFLARVWCLLKRYQVRLYASKPFYLSEPD